MRYRLTQWLTVCAVALPLGCNGRGQDHDSPPPSGTATSEPAPVDTPERLLRRVLTLASNKRYDEIDTHVLPLRWEEASGERTEVRDVRSEILAAIRDPAATGEFAYSHRALLSVVTHHLGRFAPVPKAMLEDWAAGKEWGQDPGLRDAATRRPDDLCCFRHAGAFILLEKKGGRYYLRYWSNLNKVLGEAATRRADDSGYLDLEPVTAKLKDGRVVRVALTLVVPAEKAGEIGKLMETRADDARDWLLQYLRARTADELTGPDQIARRGEEVRTGLGQLFKLPAESQILRVMWRELVLG